MDEELDRIREKRMDEIKQRIMKPPSDHEGILVLNQQNFTSAVRENQNLIIDFWAPWCGPCKMLVPVIEQLSILYSGKVRFAKCNTDENQQIAYQFGISAIPAIFFYQNGNVVHTISGALPREQLEAVVRSVYHIV
jgi:thioredoxin 1